MKTDPLFDPKVRKFFISAYPSRTLNLIDANIGNVTHFSSLTDHYCEDIIEPGDIVIGDGITLAEIAHLTQKGITYFAYEEPAKGDSLNLQRFTVNTHDRIASAIEVMNYGKPKNKSVQHSQGQIQVTASVQGLELVLTDLFGAKSIVRVILDNGSDWYIDAFPASSCRENSCRGIHTVIHGGEQKCSSSEGDFLYLDEK